MKIHSGRYLIVALLFSTSFIACAPADSSGTSSPPVFDGSDLSAHRHWRWRHRDLGSVTPPPSDLAEAPAPADLAGAPAPADMGEAGPFSISAVDPPSGPLGTVLTVTGSGLQSGDTVQISGSNLAAAALVTISLTSSSIIAELPVGSAPVPSTVKVQVRRGSDALPSAGLPFQVTSGSVYYIAPNGSDSAAGTRGAPWATLNHAAQKMKPGDVTYARGGSYDHEMEIDASGTASAPLTFRGYPGETPIFAEPASNPGGNLSSITVTGAYVVLDHLTITNHYTTGQGLGISKSANHVTVSNCDLYGAPQQNMILDGHDCLIYKNRIHDSGRAGYYVFYSHGLYIEGPNNTIRSNLIYNNQTNGVQLYNGYGTLAGGNVLEYNYIFHNGWVAQATPSSHSYAGIIVSDGHPNTTIRDNRLCGNAQYGVLVQHYDGAALSGTSITDNVTCYNGYGGIWLDEGASETVLRNISYYDKPYAISTISGVTSDYDTIYSGATTPLLGWNGKNLSLAAFRSASGQEAHGQVADPQLKKVGSAFDLTSALGYDFCTPLNSALCKPAP